MPNTQILEKKIFDKSFKARAKYEGIFTGWMKPNSLSERSMYTSNDSCVLCEMPNSGQAILVPCGCCLELLQGYTKKPASLSELQIPGPKLF